MATNRVDESNPTSFLSAHTFRNVIDPGIKFIKREFVKLNDWQKVAVVIILLNAAPHLLNIAISAAYFVILCLGIGILAGKFNDSSNQSPMVPKDSTPQKPVVHLVVPEMVHKHYYGTVMQVGGDLKMCNSRLLDSSSDYSNQDFSRQDNKRYLYYKRNSDNYSYEDSSYNDYSKHLTNRISSRDNRQYRLDLDLDLNLPFAMKHGRNAIK